MSDHVPYNEKELLLRIADGDEMAFETLYIKYARVLIPFLNKLTHNTGIAEDILQQALLAVWLHRDQLPGLDNPKQWIFRIAANQASTWMTKAATMRRLQRISGTPGEEDQSSVIVQLDFNEVRRMVNAAVNTLSPQRKKIFLLYSDQGMAYTEIARELNISASTVRTSVSIALQKIREQLGDAGIGIFLYFFLHK